jgi:hypothetical protein
MGSTASALYLCVRNLLGGLGPLMVAGLTVGCGLAWAMLVVPAMILGSGLVFWKVRGAACGALLGMRCSRDGRRGREEQLQRVRGHARGRVGLRAGSRVLVRLGAGVLGAEAVSCVQRGGLLVAQAESLYDNELASRDKPPQAQLELQPAPA